MKRLVLFSVLIFLLSHLLCGVTLEKNLFKYSINDDNTVTILGYSGRAEIIDIPSSIDEMPVTIIGERAFMYSSLKTINIPNTVVKIEGGAFAISAIRTIFIPNSVKYVGEGAINSCERLKTIVVESNDNIVFAASALSNNQSLEAVQNETGDLLGNSEYIVINNKIILYLGVIAKEERHIVINMPENSYTTKVYTEPEEVVIPTEINGQKITSIGDYAFYNKKVMKKVTIPENITYIGRSAFGSCHGLSNIEILGDINQINDGVFSGCINLTEITLPKNITHIGNNAFTRCRSLESIALPFGVTHIGDQAFKECTKLEKIIIPSTVNFVGDRIFQETPALKQIIDENGKAWGNADIIVVNEGILSYIGNDSDVIIPETINDIPITKIYSDAFSFRYFLTTVAIPNTIVEIRSGAFSVCHSLNKVTLPTGLKEISPSLFSLCNSLTEIVLPETITQIGEKAFMQTGLEKIVIPQNVTTIGSGAFGMCYSLKEVYLPKALTHIDKDAFFGSNDITIFAEKESYAAKFAEENNIRIVYIKE